MKCRRCHKEINNDSTFCMYCGTKQTVDIKPKTRGNGQGSAYKQPNGKWSAELTLGYTVNEEGKLKRHTKKKTGFETKKAALEWLEDYKRQGEKKEATIQELWKKFELTSLSEKSETKISHYKTAYRRLKPIWFRNITTLGIDDYQLIVNEYSDKFYACKDIKNLLSHLYNIAMAEQIVASNLSQFIALPSHEETERKPWTPEEINTFWQAWKDEDPFVGYILIMLYTGMMPGELRNVTRPMVDYEAHTIVGAGIKTKKRKDAPIVLADAIIPVIQRQFEITSDFRLYTHDKKQFYADYYDCLDRIKVQHLSPYSCRHTTATALADLNTNQFVIKEIMRHAKITTTQRYVHTQIEPMIDAVNKIG